MTTAKIAVTAKTKNTKENRMRAPVPTYLIFSRVFLNLRTSIMMKLHLELTHAGKNDCAADAKRQITVA